MRNGVAFTNPEHEISGMSCNVCGELMDVRRNVDGPTGYAEAVGKRSHLHDFFFCPFRDDAWHKQIHKLYEAIRETPSKRLADIMKEEIDDILDSREPTKEVGFLT